MLKTIHTELLDKDWLEMLGEAKEIGLTVEEVKLFLRENTKQEQD
ncbi:DNA-binding anti-repressor SinI [Sediminibacillus massiliensis]|nr:DNA-binding anti-repressor SinI [Sediminibacillus massiliensis]